MELRELKNSIESENCTDRIIIFCGKDDFIPTQYYRQIANYKGLEISVIEELPQVSYAIDIFGIKENDNSLKVYRVDKFEDDGSHLRDKNIIIICKSIDKQTEKIYSDYVVKVPVLEDWHIKDYVYTNCKGVNEANLNWLISICNSDIHRINNEIDKMLVFSDGERQELLSEMYTDGMFSDLTNQTIFNLTNAIFQRDVKSISRIYNDKDAIDYSDMGFITLLYKGFRNIVNIQLNPNATAESCGLKSGQFYAIKKNNIGYYSNQELVNILKLLSKMESNIRFGIFPQELTADYLLIKIINGGW